MPNDEMHGSFWSGRRTKLVFACGVLALVAIVPFIAATGSSPRLSGVAENASGTNWREPIQVASGQAHHGPWRMNESDFRWVDDPSAAVTAEGAVSVLWVDQANKDIFFQRYGRDGKPELRTPTNVSRTSEVFSWLPRIAIDPEDPSRVFALWQEIVFSGGSHGGEIFFASSSDGGNRFETPSNLSNSMAGDGKGRLTQSVWDNGSLDLALGPKGHLYVAWTEYEGALWFRRSTDHGKSFAPALRIGGSRRAPARGPSVAVHDETVQVAWALGERPSADIQFATSTDAGKSFTPANVAVRTQARSDAPKIAFDPRGILHLVFAEAYAERPGVGTLARRPARSLVRYTLLAKGGHTFRASRRIAEFNDDAENELDASFPYLETDARGWIYVAWEHSAESAARPRGLGFTYSTDGGGNFRASRFLESIAPAEGGFNGSLQGSLMDKLAVNRAGQLAFVNSTFYPNEKSFVWLLMAKAR